MLTRRLGEPPAPWELDGLVAVVDGVRLAMARCTDPMGFQEARVVVDAYLEGVGLSRSPDAG